MAAHEPSPTFVSGLIRAQHGHSLIHCLWLLLQDKGRAESLQQKTQGPKAKTHAPLQKKFAHSHCHKEVTLD